MTENNKTFDTDRNAEVLKEFEDMKELADRFNADPNLEYTKVMEELEARGFVRVTDTGEFEKPTANLPKEQKFWNGITWEKKS